MLGGVSESNIISKPFIDDELTEKIRQALNIVRLRANEALSSGNMHGKAATPPLSDGQPR